MKKPNPLKQILFALAFVFALAAFIPAAHPVEAQAKTYKISANPKWQKAPVMKKTGTYAVTAKKNDSYISFVAPKDGTYKFTISKIKTLGSNEENLGNWYPRTASSYGGSYLPTIDVKTEGGKSDCLWTASSNYSYIYTNQGKKKVDQYLKTRSATVKMKKGQKIWFSYYYTGTKCSYTVTVKKTK